MKADFANPASPTVGTERGPSITSEFPIAFRPVVRAALRSRGLDRVTTREGG